MIVFEHLLEQADQACRQDDGLALQDRIGGICQLVCRTSDAGLRRGVVDVIADRLRLRPGESQPRWSGRYYDLRQLWLTDEVWDFSNIVISKGTWLHFDLGEFRQCELRFDHAQLADGGSLLLNAANFMDTRISLLALRQSGGALGFSGHLSRRPLCSSMMPCSREVRSDCITPLSMKTVRSVSTDQRAIST